VVVRTGKFEMFSWIARRREIAGQTEVEAEALIAVEGARAYAEARQRQRESFNAEDAARWRRVAVAIAKRTGRRIGLDTATRMVADADMTATQDVAKMPRPAPPPKGFDPLDELSATIARGERRDG